MVLANSEAETTDPFRKIQPGSQFAGEPGKWRTYLWHKVVNKQIRLPFPWYLHCMEGKIYTYIKK